MDLSVVPYGHGDTDSRLLEKNGRVVDEPGKIRYRECLRNHAASIGGHANDGCGEFMPGGDEATAESLKCAACGCHRNFHRKDLADHHHPMILYKKKMGCFSPRSLPLQSQQHPALFQAVDLREHRRSETPEGDVQGSKKRFRTKFTQEQKDKMQAFADKLGWRLQKHDDVALQEFCMEIGVKRHVLKVWMHNNKNTLGLGKKETTIGL